MPACWLVECSPIDWGVQSKTCMQVMMGTNPAAGELWVMVAGRLCAVVVPVPAMVGCPTGCSTVRGVVWKQASMEAILL